MDDDWENESISEIFTEVQVKSQWDDEDVDDNNVKESWEDEEDQAKPNPVAAKDLKKLAAKASEKKGKAVEEPLDPIAEKLRQQRTVEEADYISTKELFANREEQKTLNDFIPKSESDFKKYAELIAQKLRSHEKSYHYTGLLKAVMRLSMAAMTGIEAKEIASSVSAIVNEKIKAEKDAINGRKKAGGMKKQLFLDRPDDSAAINAYDGYDDYDFM